MLTSDVSEVLSGYTSLLLTIKFAELGPTVSETTEAFQRRNDLNCKAGKPSCLSPNGPLRLQTPFQLGSQADLVNVLVRPTQVDVNVSGHIDFIRPLSIKPLIRAQAPLSFPVSLKHHMWISPVFDFRDKSLRNLAIRCDAAATRRAAKDEAS
jgi:hypothetical protein